jgi:hypothetical protein
MIFTGPNRAPETEKSMIITPQMTAMASSYARSFIAAGLAVYLSGNTDPQAILSAGVAAVVPVLLRWVNKNDSAFGRGTSK